MQMYVWIIIDDGTEIASACRKDNAAVCDGLAWKKMSRWFVDESQMSQKSRYTQTFSVLSACDVSKVSKTWIALPMRGHQEGAYIYYRATFG